MPPFHGALVRSVLGLGRTWQEAVDDFAGHKLGKLVVTTRRLEQPFHRPVGIRSSDGGDHLRLAVRGMLHVRMVSPASLTEQLTDNLITAPGVHNVVVQAGAGRRPDGDAVDFDLREDVANPVFAALRDSGLDRVCVIAVQQVDAAIADHVRGTAEHGALRREKAPVWEMVEAVIRDGARYAPSFYILLAIAGLIGAVGILTNSQILIVGAMVVGPEYHAIIAVALGIHKRESEAIRDGLFALLWGFVAAILVTTLFGLTVRALGIAPEEYLIGIRPVAHLIDSPDVYSIIVAVLAGIVGVVSLTEARVNALIGVFISVTTIPAAAALGLSLAFASWNAAVGSALQLLLNVVVLIVVGAVGLSVQRRIWQRSRARPAAWG